MKRAAKALWLVFGMFLLFTFGCASPGVANLAPSEVGRADYYLTGEIDEQSTEILDVLIRADGRPVLIEINSPGGVADEGLAIHKILRASKSPTTCLVNGRAASAAFLVLQGCTRRSMTSTSYLFMHEPTIVFAQGATLTPAPMEMALASLDKTADDMAKIIAPRLDMSVDAYKARVRGEGWTMRADDAISANAIDVVVDGTRSPL